MGGGTATLSLRATSPSYHSRTEKVLAISTLTRPTEIAEPVVKRKREISLLVTTGSGRAFSGQEDDYSRLVCGGLRGVGGVGDDAAARRCKV
jgi:hypothetical protein